MSAPKDAIEYYTLPKDAKMRDLFLSIRADEAFHREMNHKFSEMRSYEPFEGTSDKLYLVEEWKKHSSLKLDDATKNCQL